METVFGLDLSQTILKFQISCVFFIPLLVGLPSSLCNQWKDLANSLAIWEISNLSDSLESFFSISAINSAHIPCSHLLWHKSPLHVLHLSGGKKPPDVFVTVILQVGIGRNRYPQWGVIPTHSVGFLNAAWTFYLGFSTLWFLASEFFPIMWKEGLTWMQGSISCLP